MPCPCDQPSPLLTTSVTFVSSFHTPVGPLISGFRLIINAERPTFVLYPEDVDVTEPLKTAIFTCKAEGKPKPRITWYKEDLLIQGPASDKQSQFHITTNGALVYTGKRYHVTNEGSLIIVDPVSEDEGSLKCVAENSLGRVSHKVTLYLDMSKFQGRTVNGDYFMESARVQSLKPYHKPNERGFASEGVDSR